jgi:Recombination endonuclease VII
LDNPEGKERDRWGTLSRRYGIAPEQYNAALAGQNFACTICQTNLLALDTRQVHVDHDDVPGLKKMPPEGKRKHVRGILCGKRNAAIGLLDHDTDRLAAAIDYLAQHHHPELAAELLALEHFLEENNGLPTNNVRQRCLRNPKARQPRWSAAQLPPCRNSRPLVRGRLSFIA